MTKIVKGYKFRIYPNQAQMVLLERTFGCCRFVWNNILSQINNEYNQWKKNHTLPKPTVNFPELSSRLTSLKGEQDKLWLNDISSVALQQKVRDLSISFGNFFGKNRNKKTKYPKFKKKGYCESFQLTTKGFRFDNGFFYIAKSNTPVKVKWSRELPTEPTSCTISKTPSGEYYVSFLCEVEPRLTYGQNVTGIDLGIKNYLIQSNGVVIPNPKHYLQLQRKLGRLQRQHSNKQKKSNNRNKSRIRITKLHQRIANLRKDFLHKLSTQLIRENQAIGLESLFISGMIRNRKLSKHIADAGWGMFVQFLIYKARESHWTKLVFMDSFFPSSHLCSCCGEKLNRKLSLSERTWICPSCNTIHDRDDNAAKVIEIMTQIVLDNCKNCLETIYIADGKCFKIPLGKREFKLMESK